MEGDSEESRGLVERGYWRFKLKEGWGFFLCGVTSQYGSRHLNGKSSHITYLLYRVYYILRMLSRCLSKEVLLQEGW